MVSKEKVLVQFENVQERYFIDDDKPVKIEYVLNSEFEPSTKDWLGIFPKGWRGLEQQLLGEHAVTRSSKDNKRKRVIEFNLSFLLNGKMNFFNAHYQIVYVSKNMQVLGRSSYFCLQRKYGDILSRGDNAGVFEDNGAAKISKNLSPPPLPLCTNPNPPVKSIVRTVNCGGVGFPLVKPYRSESVLPYYARDFIPHCRYCSNVMQQNHSLLNQVKEFAQINRQLNQSLANLEQKYELSIAAQKRLKLWCYCLRQEKHAYEGFVGELLKCLQGNLPVCLRDSVKGSEMFVQRVGADLNNHIVPHPMRHTSSVSDRYLKAIIGSQEMKIQDLQTKLNDLTRQLAQFEMNSQQTNCGNKLLELKSNKHSDFEEYKNDKNTNINNTSELIDSSSVDDIISNEEIKGNEVVKKNGYNSKSAQEIHAIIEVCRANEKLQAVICDVNNNCDFSDDDDDGDNNERLDDKNDEVEGAGNCQENCINQNNHDEIVDDSAGSKDDIS